MSGNSAKEDQGNSLKEVQQPETAANYDFEEQHRFLSELVKKGF